MEGRAIARPNQPAERSLDLGVVPSMEGRAIAQPNLPAHVDVVGWINRFNGGPSNCPAKQACLTAEQHALKLLQWRAEQLPGQTGAVLRHPLGWRHRFNGGPSNCPAKPGLQAVRERRRSCASMEGRAIARPNMDPITTRSVVDCLASMEGRAIARPNSTCSASVHAGSSPLQWRAEQLPGQTGGGRRRGPGHSACFNGGPSNCPAKLGPLDGDRCRPQRASMEGRAIARPNPIL